MNPRIYVPLLITVFILLLVATLVVPRHLIKSDYDSYCQSFKDFISRMDGMDEAMNSVQFSQEVAEQTVMPSARRAFDAIASADPVQKYELVDMAAKESGYPEWECPPMKEYLTSLKSESEE